MLEQSRFELECDDLRVDDLRVDDWFFWNWHRSIEESSCAQKVKKKSNIFHNDVEMIESTVSNKQTPRTGMSCKRIDFNAEFILHRTFASQR